MRAILVLLLALFATAAFAAPKGALENPQPNDYASGIYLFSGWVCDAETVQIGLDGVQLLDVAYGSDRLDTHNACGDSDNGFGLLVNMANLAPGAHEAVLYADGQIIAQHAFNTAALSSGEFAEDLDGCAISEGFPRSDKDTIVKWTTSLQGFQITEERARFLANNVNGIWLADFSWSASIWTYRADCGATSLFLYANIENNLGETHILRMTGPVGEEETLLQSTSNDVTQREATLIFKSDTELHINITSCERLGFACDYTAPGMLVILRKVANIMDTEFPSAR
jgi:hypothetical protein